MLLVELNEFSVDFLREASAFQSTPSLDRILSWPCCETTSEEKTERHGLDPWVQWVSIHTGVPASEHGIAHLGEADKLVHEQIWDCLNKAGVSTTVWGPMNGKNNKHPLMQTFFPDPWTFSEVAAPDSLNGLLALPRLYAQDYVRPNRWRLLRGGFQTGGYLLVHHLAVILRNAGTWFASVVKGGLNNAVLFALFDNLSAKLFGKTCPPDSGSFKLIFFNSIAHLQHHDWRADSAKVQTVIRLLEDTLTTVLAVTGEEEPVLVANAFSQVCTTSKREYLYRPVDPEGLIDAFKIRYSRVEQMMTNDGHIFFADAQDCDEACSILAAATIDGRNAFDIDRRDRCQLFYQFILWDHLPEDAVLQVNGRSLSFYEHFEKLVQRTGSHVSTGQIFYTNIEMPGEMPNHGLFHRIKDCYV